MDPIKNIGEIIAGNLKYDTYGNFTKKGIEYYLPPEVSYDSLFTPDIVSAFDGTSGITTPPFKTSTGEAIPPWISFVVPSIHEMAENLYKFFVILNAQKSNILNNETSDADMFSIYYDIFGIPNYSYSLVTGTIMSNLNTALSKVSNTFIINNFLGCNDVIFNISQIDNLFLYINPKNSVSERALRRKYSNEVYKLHICVDASYQIFTFMKLALLVSEYYRKTDPTRYLLLKAVLNGKSVRPLLTDTFFRKINGGPMASIVYYTFIDNPEELLDLLRYLIPKFPEEATRGLMSLEGTDTLPYGNVRVNRMFCYAQGERETKLDKKIANLKILSKYPNGSRVPSVKVIPRWIKDLKEGSMSESANISAESIRKSQHFLGVNLREINPLNSRCVNDICYISSYDNLLNPNSIMPPKKPVARNGNNTGAGAGAGAGGSRKIKKVRKTRKQRNKKKQK